MGVEAAVAANVQRDRAAVDEDSRDEQEAVADGRILLAAHQRDAVLLDAGLDPVDPLQETRHFGERRVQHVPLVVVTVRLGRSAAEFLAHEQVLASGRHDGLLQRLAVELRAVLRIGLSPDIDQHVDLVLPQQSAEMLVGVIGMPDREEALIGNNEVGHETPFLPHVTVGRRPIERRERVKV